MMRVGLIHAAGGLERKVLGPLRKRKFCLQTAVRLETVTSAKCPTCPPAIHQMATHSSALAWRIQGTGEPGGLPSVGSRRVGHDWSNLAGAYSHKPICREPAWVSPPMAKVMRKEALAYAKVGSSLRKPPVPEHLPPKPESLLYCFMLSPIPLTLWGGADPHHLSRRRS